MFMSRKNELYLHRQYRHQPDTSMLHPTYQQFTQRLFLLIVLMATVFPAFAKNGEHDQEEKHIKKVLFIGDSMTGWMAERLNAYGKNNGFEVATVVWDGSTISKWANSSRLTSIIREQDPDAIFISLGMNELLERNPSARLSSSMTKLKKAFGNIPTLWIGPPSWPGKPGGDALNSFLAQEMGEGHYFHSSGLNLSRQSSRNPHPSRQGIIHWIDTIADWIPEHTQLKFKSLDNPGANEMSRGKTFIYKRMRETL